MKPEWIEKIEERASAATPGKQEARFLPGGMPTNCCNYAVISLETGLETMRCWTPIDAISYAELHNDRSALLSHVIVLREALEFYANHEKNCPDEYEVYGRPDIFGWEHDEGRTAQEALLHDPTKGGE